MINVVIHATDERVAGILGQILASASPVSVADPATTWIELRRSIALRAGTVVVLGPDTADADLAQVPKAIHDYPGTTFVYVADTLDAATLQHAMRHGIRDVVAVADAESDLPAAVMRAHAFAQSEVGVSSGKSPAARGKAVTVLGAKGGTGKTMLATNIAVLAASSGVTTVLVDACVVFGDCSAVLRVRPSHSIADLAGAVAVDEALVAGLLAEHDSGLHLLAAPNDPMAADGLDARTLAQAIDCLKRTHELVVVDTGPGMGSHALAAHAESDLSYLITSLELPAVKDAKMMLNALSQRASGIDDHVQVVLNRANSKVGFPPDEVARALGRSAAVELPSDVAVPRSINNGVVVALESPKSRIGKALTKLSADMRGDLFGRENASGRKSLLRVAKARAATS